MKIDIPEGAKPEACRSCGATIYWSETVNKKPVPVDPDGTNHFITCPDRKKWRKK